VLYYGVFELGRCEDLGEDLVEVLEHVVFLLEFGLVFDLGPPACYFEEEDEAALLYEQFHEVFAADHPEHLDLSKEELPLITIRFNPAIDRLNRDFKQFLKPSIRLKQIEKRHIMGQMRQHRRRGLQQLAHLHMQSAHTLSGRQIGHPAHWGDPRQGVEKLPVEEGEGLIG
jgi:hypothetical protein